MLQDLASQSIWQRFDYQVKHRFELSENQKINFPNNALYTLADKTKVFAVQGFGRFGPLGPSESDSTVRFDRRQDWGAILWAPSGALRPGHVDSARCEPVPSRPAADRARAGHLGRPGVGRGDGLSPHGLGPVLAADPERQRLAGRDRGCGDLGIANRCHRLARDHSAGRQPGSS